MKIFYEEVSMKKMKFIGLFCSYYWYLYKNYKNCLIKLYNTVNDV